MKGVLLLQLGTPEAPTKKAVAAFLREFLMDERVIDIPGFLRFLLVNFWIVPLRASTSAEAYREIWTENGSPLLYHSKVLEKKLQEKLTDRFFVKLGMRYGKPNLEDTWKEFQKACVEGE